MTNVSHVEVSEVGCKKSISKLQPAGKNGQTKRERCLELLSLLSPSADSQMLREGRLLWPPWDPTGWVFSFLAFLDLSAFKTAHAIFHSGCRPPPCYQTPSSCYSTVMASTTSLLDLLTPPVSSKTLETVSGSSTLISSPTASSTASDSPPFPLALVLSCVLVAYLLVLLILIGVRSDLTIKLMQWTILRYIHIRWTLTSISCHPRSYITRRGLAAECCGVSDTDSTCHDCCSSGCAWTSPPTWSSLQSSSPPSPSS